MPEKKAHSATILAAVFGGAATIIAAIITIVPELLKLNTDAVEQTQPIQKPSQTIPKKETPIDGASGTVSEVVAKSTDKSNAEKIVDEGNRDVKTSKPQQTRIAKSVPASQPVTQSLEQPIGTSVPIKTPEKIDLSGIWKFDADIVRGKDTTGTLFDYNSNYKPIVELTQTGDKISGTYSGPPAIVCGTGSITGSLSQDSETAKVEWVLDCTSECDGEQRKFIGTYNQTTKTIAGRYKPIKTPTKKGCWLAFENLSGKLDF